MIYSIQKLNSYDTETIRKVCDLLRNTYPEKISQYFIYNDHSYHAFFTANLNRTDQFIYYILISDKNVIDKLICDKVIGFAQFKIVANTLFLINLIVDQKYQKHKFGSKLLSFGVQSAIASLPFINTFELNTFASNTILEWYLRLGMKIISSSYWYGLENMVTDKQSEEIQNTSESFHYKTDQYGFTQLFLNNQPVGYLINGKKLIVKSNLDSQQLQNIPLTYNNEMIEPGCVITDKMLDLPLIDKCFLLNIPLTELRFKTAHLSTVNS